MHLWAWFECKICPLRASDAHKQLSIQEQLGDALAASQVRWAGYRSPWPSNCPQQASACELTKCSGMVGYSSVRSGVACFVGFGRGLGVGSRWLPCLVPTQVPTRVWMRVRLRGTGGG